MLDSENIFSQMHQRYTEGVADLTLLPWACAQIILRMTRDKAKPEAKEMVFVGDIVKRLGMGCLEVTYGVRGKTGKVLSRLLLKMSTESSPEKRTI